MRREPPEVRKRTLATVLLNKAGAGIQFNEHCDDLPADIVFRHACKLGFEGIVSKRLGSPYRSGRSREDEEPERTRSKARGGGGLGQGEVAMTNHARLMELQTEFPTAKRAKSLKIR